MTKSEKKLLFLRRLEKHREKISTCCISHIALSKEDDRRCLVKIKYPDRTELHAMNKELFINEFKKIGILFEIQKNQIFYLNKFFKRVLKGIFECIKEREAVMQKLCQVKSVMSKLFPGLEINFFKFLDLERKHRPAVFLKPTKLFATKGFSVPVMA